MSSLNSNFFFSSWFSKPPNPNPLLLPNLLFSSAASSCRPPFASISSSSSSSSAPTNPSKDPNSPSAPPFDYSAYVDRYFWECENLPDYRYTPEVERILNEHPLLEARPDATPEEIAANEKWWNDFRSHPIIKFMRRAEEISDQINEQELRENRDPYHREDRDYWRAIPHVTGLDGRPMPRKSIQTKEESDDKFWDFMKQFQFGLWGFRQRPYPPGRPIDVAQAIGYKRLEKRYHDFIMKSGGFFYKDRLGRTRGPMELIQLKTAWGAGIIDKHTFIWGEDMDEWAPICMVYGMERAIATWEVRLGAAATAFIHKLQKGIPPWVPLKGHEPKTYKQLQEEAVESKRRDMAVLRANGGVWPGVTTPSYALFLWASGAELTTILEQDHMPNKYISKDLRIQLAKIIPGLRPWEVLSIEQAMDQITYGGEWYREPLGTFHTGPPYIRHWNKDVMRLFKVFFNLSTRTYEKLVRTIPGFDQVMEKVQVHTAEKEARWERRREADKRAKEKARFGDVPVP